MKIENDIEELLSTKRFNELSDSEKAFVLSELESEKAYNDLRHVILSFKEMEQDEAPDAMRENIMAAFDKEFDSTKGKVIPLHSDQKKRNIIKPLIYMLVAASVLIAVFILLPQTKNPADTQLAENKTKTATEFKKDSVSPTVVEQKVENESIDHEAEAATELAEIITKKPDVPQKPELNNQSIERLADEVELTYSDSDESIKNELKDYSEDADLQEPATNYDKSEKELETQTAADLAAAPQSIQESFAAMEKAESAISSRAQGVKRTKNSDSKDGNILLLFKLNKLNTPHYTAY